jgi:hypothetical protein
MNTTIFGTPTWRAKQDVLTGLRHRAVSSSHHKDGAVHLGGTRNHVLHIVGVTWAVHVCIVTLFRLVFNVRSVDGDTALFFFRSASMES